MLHHPDLNKEFTLRCDASDTGIRSILLQNERIIGYYSKKYNQQELNYTTIEKEVLAIIKSLDHFKHLIFNTKVTIETDNKNLTFDGNFTKRLQRWKLLMDEYDYQLRYIEENNFGGRRSFEICTRCYIKKRQRGAFNRFEIKIYKRSTSKNKVHGKICLTNQDTNEVYNFLRNIHVELLHPGVLVFEQTLKKYFRVQGMRK
ncbi:Retrovirus-related Pol polyprotein from transposon 17.6 [Dictyocoela muelleri]|nr:Retrovirus-related Pol polyprotein from transposon 17.6 [Dictyocoela muelleri]